MQTDTQEIDPVAIVKTYDLRNMSAKVGILAGSLTMFRVFALKEPDWATPELQSIMKLQPMDHPDEVVEQAYGEYERFVHACGSRNSRMRPIGWDYNVGI
jgi:hypothetical protein